jgi:hypothetical protein
MQPWFWILIIFIFVGRVGSQIVIPYRGNEYDCNQLKVMGDLGQLLFFVSIFINKKSLENYTAHGNSCTHTTKHLFFFILG